MRSCALIVAAAAGLAAAGCTDGGPGASRVVHLTANLTPQGELGATLQGTTTSSVGKFDALLDTSTNVLTYTVSYSGLSSNVSAGHIHGPFVAGGDATTAPAILDLDPTAAGSPLGSSATFVKGATAGSAAGSVSLGAGTAISPSVSGDSLKQLLLSGDAYANIHTTANADGEIRGRIKVVP